MKQTTLIAVTVGISIIAVLGVLFVINYVNSAVQMESQKEIERDMERADVLRDEYTKIESQLCLDEPPPISVGDARALLIKFARIQSLEERYAEKLQQLRSEMRQLSEKYSNPDYFVFDDPCSNYYKSEWDMAIIHLREFTP